jgi:hypothetical protein
MQVVGRSRRDREHKSKQGGRDGNGWSIAMRKCRSKLRPRGTRLLRGANQLRLYGTTATGSCNKYRPFTVPTNKQNLTIDARPMLRTESMSPRSSSHPVTLVSTASRNWTRSFRPTVKGRRDVRSNYFVLHVF